jgi:16S rRNA (cytosine1402-N4)-methyltransferase
VDGQGDNAPRGGHGVEAVGHVSVLLQEAIEFLAVKPGGLYVDATVGLGGHSFEIAKRLGPRGRLIGLDKDPAALQHARARLTQANHEAGSPGRAGFARAGVADWPEVRLQQASFAELAALVDEGSADGILADLGLSSLQLGEPARGFSFQAEGPLDMRMDPRSGPTAEQVVNQLSERELADLIYEFGEERRSRRIARAIVRSRPLHTSKQLAEVVAAAARPMKLEKIHPATRTFQAIRIYVNHELDDLRALLEAAPRALKTGGRLVLINFHSLEDRIVKDALRQGARDGLYRLLTKKPVTASGEEVSRNPRSRSAKLRAAERAERKSLRET